MKILSFESSTALGSVAAIENGRVLAARESQQQQSHTEHIHRFALEILNEVDWKWSDVDAFACGSGPGSFTGIRISANTAKTFAYGFNKPLVTVDSLSVLTAQVQDLTRPVLPMINAYKNMIYCASMSHKQDIVEILRPPEAIPVRDLAGVITEDHWVVGDGWLSYVNFFPSEFRRYLHRPTSPQDYPTAATLGILAEKKYLHKNSNSTFEWKSFVPLYIRASEAEENKRGILLKPLK